MSNDRFVSTGIVPTQAGPDQPSPVHNTPPVSTGDALTGEGSARQPVEAAAAAADRVRLVEGDVIKARYRVVRHIAGGGMGDVYEVFDNVSREPRAVKLMKSHLLNSSQARERFIKESKAQDLRHPHIVKTIDIDDWPERNVLFITMELVPGQTLRQWFHEAAQAKRHPAFSVSDTLEICRQVCAALVYAHRVTIHRDIKPENLLLDRAADGRWQVRIADFGITKLLEVTDFTATNQVFGTFQYMAPEQHRDAASVDHRADIYSVGVVLYELLTGQLPQGRFKLPSECGGSIPREADTLITRALASDRNDRYADMAMMQADIERVLQSVTGAAAPRMPWSESVAVSTGALGKIVVELQERRMPQVAVTGLPPIPEEILSLRARADDLKQAIHDLDKDLHPVLRPHLATLRQIEEQYDAFVRERAELGKGVDGNTVAELESLLATNPRCDLQSLRGAAGKVSIAALLPLVSALRNVELARQAKESGSTHFQSAKQAEIVRLIELHTKANLMLARLYERDFNKLLPTVLPRDKASDLFPFATWAAIATGLTQQGRYPWTDWEALERAERYWQYGIQVAPEVRISRRRWIGGILGGASAIALGYGVWSANRPIRVAVKWKSALEPGSQAGERTSFTLNDIEYAFRWCPAGTFMMGRPQNEKDHRTDEVQVSVELTRGIWMQETEVTQSMWEGLMGSGLDWSQYGRGPQHPVYNVSHGEAVAFCETVNTALKSVSETVGLAVWLPREAEWEYACRAGTTSRFFWGDDESQAGDFAWYARNSNGTTHPVGKKKANGWGLCDMGGNVWEMCSDGESETLPGGRDPQVPAKYSFSIRMCRGGGFRNYEQYLPSAERNIYSGDDRDNDHGFRLALRHLLK